MPRAALVLPPPSTVRWTPVRKLGVLLAIRRGQIGLADARTTYGLDVHELAEWGRAFDRHGPPALQVTKLQRYRR